MRVVIRTVGGIPLCGRHLEAVVADLGSLSPLVVSEIDAVVYYLGDPPTQQIKIGTSTRLLQRFEVLKVARPRVVLLAVEPGHFDLERVRHRQFASWRVEHKGRFREWYEKNDGLMAHVNEVRAQYGEPWRWVGQRQIMRGTRRGEAGKWHQDSTNTAHAE